MKIAVASGKGGVGKSMVASALAMTLAKTRRVVAVDCDVDAPDLGIWLGMAETEKGEKISTSETAVIDYGKCIGCGKCAQVCRFGAINFKDKKPQVLPYLCEGCGVCEFYCPANAISLRPVDNGEIISTETRHGFPLVTGVLYPGYTGSGKVVTALKEKAAEFEHDVMVLDSAAGIGCPVIASLNGVDYAVLVTEPTPSGFSDLRRVLEIVNHFKVPYGVIINKWDINEEMSAEIEKWAKGRVLGKLPFDKEVFVSVSELTPIMESGSRVKEDLQGIFKILDTIK
jgi:MinD superfamily P-loop ATPase